MASVSLKNGRSLSLQDPQTRDRRVNPFVSIRLFRVIPWFYRFAIGFPLISAPNVTNLNSNGFKLFLGVMITGSWLVWQHMDTLDGLIFKMIQNSLSSMNRSEPWQQNKVRFQVIYSALSRVEIPLGTDPYFRT